MVDYRKIGENIKFGLFAIGLFSTTVIIEGGVIVGLSNLSKYIGPTYHTEFREVELTGDPSKPERVGIKRDQEGNITQIYLDVIDGRKKEYDLYLPRP